MEEFYYPQKYKWLSLFAIAFFSLLSIGSLVITVVDYKGILNSLIFIVIALFFFWFLYQFIDFFLRCNEIIITNEDEIIIKKQDQNRVRIKWKNVDWFKSRDYLNKRVELHDQKSDHIQKIDYQINDFALLRQKIIENVDFPNISSSNRFTFKTILVLRGLFIFCALLFGFFSIYSALSQEIIPAIAFFAFSIFAIFGYLWEIKTINADQSRITIKNFFNKQEFSYSNIDKIYIQDETDRSGKVPTVFIKPRNSKEIKIAYIQEGSIEIFKCINWFWERFNEKTIN